MRTQHTREGMVVDSKIAEVVSKATDRGVVELILANPWLASDIIRCVRREGVKGRLGGVETRLTYASSFLREVLRTEF